MAKFKATDAEVLSVYAGKGFRAKEDYLNENGEPRTLYFKVWGKFPEVKVGDVVNVTGDLSTRVEESLDQDGNIKLDREGKAIRYAAIHINSAVVTNNAPF
jgi:hypothetical protein